MLVRYINSAVREIINQVGVMYRSIFFLILLSTLTGCSQFSGFSAPLDWFKSGQSVIEGIIKDIKTLGELEQGSKYPTLSSVPPRPALLSSSDERARIRNQLISDRGNARYLGAKSNLWPNSMPPRTKSASDVNIEKSANDNKVVKPLTNKNTVGKPAAPITLSSPALKKLTTTSVVPETPKIKTIASSLEADRVSENAGKLKFNIPELAKEVTEKNVAFKFQLVEPNLINPKETILFGHGSYRLSNSDRSLLSKIAKKALETGAIVHVTGHASMRTRDMDELRHALANFNISVKRANVVAEFLISKGVPAERLIVDAVGDSQPINLETMPSGERANRRTEISLEAS
tara:strand:- start:92 stop:1132 length:1041 start_codon:yes stop_codon:yes gene_type:complete